MSSFFNSLKSLVSHEMISKASTVLDENNVGISKAVSSIIPGILGVILKNGSTAQLRNIFEEAGQLNILSDIENVSEEKPTKDQQRIGDNLLQHLLGDKAADFTDNIATHAGVSKVATNRLVSMLAPVVAGFFGNKMVDEKYSLHAILSELDKEKSNFAGLIPSGLINSFGLSSILHQSNVSQHSSGEKPKSKSNNTWLIWVGLIVLLLLLLFWWKSCRDEKVNDHTEDITVTELYTQEEAPVKVEKDGKVVVNADQTELTLPDGVKIQALKGGVEDEMIKFLNSDDYKNATEKELKEKWFKFDNIAFEFGSSTNLKPESKTQLDNIVAILKSYKDAKIKIGGFADKKGTEKANMEVSTKRAKTIESLLDKSGIKSQIVKAEGYGDEYAKHSANESNEQRAEDRDIALRFVK